MHNVLYIVGPTASGKTALAIKIAQKYGGEIICADSRTIYKGLDIGTAKPNKTEMSGVVHYGIDLVTPKDTFSAAEFSRRANEWIYDIESRGKLPIIVGGTGLYIDALYYGYEFPDKADGELREKLEEMSLDELHEIIRQKGYEMPENYKNKRYVIRAIERGGDGGKKNSPNPGSVIVGLFPGKEALEGRIKERAKVMFGSGVIDECRWLFAKYGYNSPGASGNIYRSLRPYFQNKSDTESCMEEFIVLDRKLAKRQMTWFKRNKDIKWFENGADAESYIDSIL